jgi:hypothetical protein
MIDGRRFGTTEAESVCETSKAIGGAAQVDVSGST